MHPGSQPPDDTAFIIFLGIAFLTVSIIYIMPSIVAFRRNHPSLVRRGRTRPVS